MPPCLALVGDYSPDVLAHRAIPCALELIRTELGWEVDWEWLPTSDIKDAARELARFAGIWLVPASPYKNMTGALSAIQFARESHRPFLGTCGGFQHALVEFARHVAGLASADHAESNPTGDTLVVTRLACSLVEQTRPLEIVSGSLLHAAYGGTSTNEGYRCNYGPAPEYRAALAQAGLRFTAHDDHGEVRAGELPTDVHPFFVGTLFQPERAALQGVIPPLVRAFVAAARQQNVSRNS